MGDVCIASCKALMTGNTQPYLQGSPGVFNGHTAIHSVLIV